MKINLLFLSVTLSAFITVSKAESPSLKNGLEVKYQFENTLADSSGNSNDLIWSNSSTLTYAAGKPSTEKALYFSNLSSANGGVSKKAISNTSWSGTAISFWINKSNTATSAATLLQGYGLGFGINIGLGVNYLSVYFDGSSAGAVNTPIVADGTWHHIVAQNNGTTTYIYVDGRLTASVAETMYKITNSDSLNKIYLGRSSTGNTFEGTLDDFRIYNRTLTACEIFELSSRANLSPFISYLFNGNLADSGPNNYPLTGTASYVYSSQDTVLSCSGTGNTLTSTKSLTALSGSSLSISFWYNTSKQVFAYQNILSHSRFSIYLGANNANISAYFDGSSTTAASYTNTKLGDGTWHHVVAMNNGSITYLYVDAVLVSQINETIATSMSGVLTVSNASTAPFYGFLENLNIYKGLLTQCEIDEMFSKVPSSIVTDVENENLYTNMFYPNPVKNILHVHTSSELLTLSGTSLAVFDREYDMSHLEPAMYLLKQNNSIFKIIKH
ncbi:MAG: LamG domain-containing protein [Cytophagales bacterium]